MARLFSLILGGGRLKNISIEGVGASPVNVTGLGPTLLQKLPTTVNQFVVRNTLLSSPMIVARLPALDVLGMERALFDTFPSDEAEASVAHATRTESIHLRPRVLLYSKTAGFPNTSFGRPSTPLPHCVSLDRVEEAHLRTEHADDFSVLTALEDAEGTGIHSLELQLDGLSKLAQRFDLQTLWKSVAWSFPSLKFLTLKLVHTPTPLTGHPWKAVCICLNSLKADGLNTLTVTLEYGGTSRLDFLRLLMKFWDWYDLDTALARFASRCSSMMNIYLEFPRWGMVTQNPWRFEEQEMAGWILLDIGINMNLGSIEFGRLSDDQMQVLLPRSYAVANVNVLWL
ncbi:hypothetical protein CC1G_04944 [Coprinopsis cinerea okayama7|uniref:F-box domain-containing protein n=1 Tax=Coprinopsis cinerea (strain Okayama-7 / 130 / ATCC MYA-4618 / FGSC 9003) TaxID=240176 RepID=A8PFM9_COPC7|nr:hypothetical protein CC1G_04944 [Coprinopsis cinerea okayama7\|eukprot:XP_001841100.2 hypothetical protein CC1G_04944 [Coprinopsis cinerea okayama7\